MIRELKMRSLARDAPIRRERRWVPPALGTRAGMIRRTAKGGERKADLPWDDREPGFRQADLGHGRT